MAMNQGRPPNRDGFEIAILCSSNVNVSAVESLFDEDWTAEAAYERGPGDPNSYKIGRIADSEVVLAYLPETGNSSAPKTVIWLKASFINIKLALLVGMCSGVPASIEGGDVLLGDVVISTGMVHYDLGRLYPNVFGRRHGINSNIYAPSPPIESFVAEIQAGETYRALQENTYQYLRDISHVQSVAFPGIMEDKLYAPSYRHKHQRKQDCDICVSCLTESDAVCNTVSNVACAVLGCSNGQLVPRNRVTHTDLYDGQLSRPSIHFGKMASTNYAMRSGVHRDEIASTEGIVAIEMEGLAIWEELPTVVVKGVCDYADSHTNNHWQKYAVTTAAACAKALIKKWKGFSQGTVRLTHGNAIGESNTFAIPSPDLRSAVMAKETGRPSFWSHKMYRDSAGNTVNVHYSTDLAESEELAITLVDEPILGFGMHWLEAGNSVVSPGESAIGLDEQNNIALVVLAKEDSICIFHLAMHNGNTTEQKIAPTLKRILESPSTLKAGVLIFQFKDKRLLARFGTKLNGIFELADLHRILDHEENPMARPEPSKHYVPINDLVEAHLHLDHYRPKKMRLSNWGRSLLQEAQISYAASDAYAGYQLFQVMDAKRRRMEPIPSLPLPAEQQTSEQNREKEFQQPSFLRKRHADNQSTANPSSGHSSAVAHEDLAAGESPAKKRKSRYPDSIDPEAKFVWRQGEPVFNFGKHWNCSLQDIAVRDRSYLGWLTNPATTFSAQVVKLARDALNGNFPTPPQDLPNRDSVD